MNTARVVRTAGRMTRPAADAPGLLQEGAVSGSPLKPSAAYSMPAAESIRRVWQWARRPPQTGSLEQMSFHEAGHAVLLELFQMPGISATASPTSGRVVHSLKLSNPPPPPTDATGALAAVVASFFHAGVCAELIWSGTPWSGPIQDLSSHDYQRANEELRERFGNHCSGAHAFSQWYALAVLSERWGRVQEIAAHLVKHGEWHGDK